MPGHYGFTAETQRRGENQETFLGAEPQREPNMACGLHRASVCDFRIQRTQRAKRYMPGHYNAPR